MQNTRALLADGLILASHNSGKLEEMRDLVAGLGVPVTSAGERGLPEPDETGDTFLANAQLKAHAACDATGLAAVGDDSGLVVPSLNGAPGIHSARWAGASRDFNAAMQRLNQEVSAAGLARDAHFISVIVLALPNGEEAQFEGQINGTLIWPPRGKGGFGYDAMFVPEGEDPQSGRSFAEMPFAEKQAVSHRGVALRRLMEWLLDAA